MNIPGLENVHLKHGRYYFVGIGERDPRTGRRKRVWTPLTRESEGLAALEAAVKAFRAGPAVLTGNFAAHAADFLKAHCPGLTPAVAKEYRRMFDKITFEFRRFDVAQVTPADILDFLGLFVRKPTARRAYKARLAGFFAWCVVYRGLPVSPVREIRLAAPPRRQARIRTAERFHQLRDALSARDQCILDLMFLTLQRPTEIRLLRESQIRREHIHFRPTKTEDSSGLDVLVPITPDIQAALDRARALRKVRPLKDVDAWLFPAEGGTSPLTKSGLNSSWKRGRLKAGLPDITTRDVRPYAMAMAKAAGYRKEDIQVGAVHASVGTTEVYLDQYADHVSVVRLALPGR